MDRIMKNKKGFGIMEVLISAVVLGFLYMALLHLQTGNHETMLRIRGRDGAIEVAQQVIDSLNRIGIASIPDEQSPTPADGDVDNKIDDDGNYVRTLPKVFRTWDRGEMVGGGHSTIEYTPTVTIMPTTAYRATSESNLEEVSHVYAKQVNVEVSWKFKGTEQSINMSTVIR